MHGWQRCSSASPRRPSRDEPYRADVSAAGSVSAQVIDQPARRRYELALEGGTAFIDYQRSGRRVLLLYAEVPPALRGQGIGARLTAGALELVRARGECVEARCPYVARFIARNAQYHDLLAPP